MRDLVATRTLPCLQVSLGAAASLRADAVSGAYKDLRALLRLLSHLTQRDLFDFDDDAAAPGGATVDVAQARPSIFPSCMRDWGSELFS